MIVFIVFYLSPEMLKFKTGYTQAPETTTRGDDVDDPEQTATRAPGGTFINQFVNNIVLFIAKEYV